MPATQLDPKTALVVIDMQKGIVGLPTVHPAADIVARVATLTRAFRAHGLPVVLVNVTGVAPGRTDAGRHALPADADWAEFLPELDRQPGDHVVTKLQWGAFHGTSLDQYLRRNGVTEVVLVGIATSIGVESTARNAYELGYNVALVVDAMTDMQAEAHRNSVETIFPRLGERLTTDEVLNLLKRKG